MMLRLASGLLAAWFALTGATAPAGAQPVHPAGSGFGSEPVGRYGLACRLSGTGTLGPPSYRVDDIGKPGVPRLTQAQIASARGIRTTLEGIFKRSYPWLWFAFVPKVDGKVTSEPQFVVFDTADQPNQIAPCAYPFTTGYRVMNLTCDYYYSSGEEPVVVRDSSGQCMPNPWRMTPLSVSEVRSITIEGSAGTRYSATIVNRDGRFVRSDGVEIPSEAIAAFTAALTHPQPWFDVARSGYDRTGLIARRKDAEAYLNEAIAMPSVRAAFDAQYFDEAALARWFQAIWIKPMETITDSYPKIDVHVQTAQGTLEAYSESQNAFMLPLYVTDRNGWRRDWDPALSRSIAAILEPSPVADTLRAANVPQNWGAAIARSTAIRDAILRDGITETAADAAAAARGLSITFDKSETSPDERPDWRGTISPAGFPHVQHAFEVWRTTLDRFGSFLDAVAATLERVRAHAWLMAALKRDAAATLEIAPWRQDYVTWADEFKNDGFAEAAATLKRDGDSVVTFEVHDGDGDSEWALLRSGGVMLLTYRGTPSFPYGPAWYVNVRHVYDSRYQVNASGVIVAPDGTIAE